MSTSSATIVCKVVCNECRRFVGFITSDGKGPILDGCLKPEGGKCEMVKSLTIYQPKRYALGLGGGRSGPIDEDAWGYSSDRTQSNE